MHMIYKNKESNMPPKRRKVAKVYIQNQDGTGFWGDVWGGIKKGAKGAYNLARNTGAVSKGLAALGRPELAAGARMVGLGRRRKAGARSQRGGASGVGRF